MRLEARVRALAAFARHRSVPAAAAKPRISQRRFRSTSLRLEHALGLRLVDRARYDGALTSAGEFVANYVLGAEALLVQADIGAAQFRKSCSGSVAAAASSLTGTYQLPEIIAAGPTSSCPAKAGHPRLFAVISKTWMAGPSPAMTVPQLPEGSSNTSPGITLQIGMAVQVVKLLRRIAPRSVS